MSGPEAEDRLWDPEAASTGELDELAARLEGQLAPLRAPEAPALELPAREPEAAAPPPKSSAGWWVAVCVAAALALWFAWRARPVPDPSPRVAQAPPTQTAPAPAIWRVEALDGENHCRPADAGDEDAPDLDAGSTLEDGASLQLGAEASARLSNGDAQLELHPSSLLRNDAGVLALLEGRAWVDLPAREDSAPWRFAVDGLTVETPSARFMVSAHAGVGIELDVITGELTIADGQGTTTAHAGQLCRARFGPAPVVELEPLECATSP
ncbi:hypothetical protein PPSIR1_29248 [Plesiocystis pacifica SIR-1]|uniref:FecR protein domain-containing protein n=1 Tax=Plesiocystis pacifica SIR-1 TaxID=391625 RepID=A6G617_9BACT|nr:hypothetical protein [Plesiocystis pacifica]EDM78619.1 hypothetical protein PPSIR1_29248 [Plesiocystis pacifica SIR-1]